MAPAQQTYIADKLSVFLGQYDVRSVCHWTVFHLVDVLPVVFLVIYQKNTFLSSVLTLNILQNTELWL